MNIRKKLLKSCVLHYCLCCGAASARAKRFCQIAVVKVEKVLTKQFAFFHSKKNTFDNIPKEKLFFTLALLPLA